MPKPRKRARLLLQVFLLKQGHCLQSLMQLPTCCKPQPQPLQPLQPLQLLQPLPLHQQTLLLLRLLIQKMMNPVCCLQTSSVSQEER